ncbi:hypothetical protein LPTSP2_06660 [Leptospira ellinghausenii]|uniref:Uncharacterized protein n=1 Tax=Leptospira ellinghausenii TaxID=1917822 RepID=A0A2P2D9U2_9LEPT|nr:hypothetical protein LPTSP2_06660 [Leptospira ellinghausenii]
MRASLNIPNSMATDTLQNNKSKVEKMGICNTVSESKNLRREKIENYIRDKIRVEYTKVVPSWLQIVSERH